MTAAGLTFISPSSSVLMHIEETKYENQEVVASGNCGVNGDNVVWVLYDSGELVISGEGAMDSYCDEAEDYAPWVNYINDISSVIINEGVTSIGDWAFAHYDGIKTMDIADTVTSMGENAIYDCNSLVSLKLPNSDINISDAIVYCRRLESIYLPENVKSESLLQENSRFEHLSYGYRALSV
jgi:hypothetical protein